MNAWQERIGVGERQHIFGRHVGKTNTSAVVADDGLLRGCEVGSRIEHWDGHVDGKVTAATVHINPNLVVRREPA